MKAEFHLSNEHPFMKEQTLEQKIRAALEPEILKLVDSTQTAIADFAERRGFAVEEVVVEATSADPGVTFSMKASRKYGV